MKASFRGMFRNPFTGAGLPYLNPDSIRNTLAQLGERRCTSPGGFKPWSQNLGHKGSYRDRAGRRDRSSKPIGVQGKTAVI